MTQTFKLSNISKLWHNNWYNNWHNKEKHPVLHSPSKSATKVRKTEDWDMSPEDALRVPYSGHK